MSDSEKRFPFRVIEGGKADSDSKSRESGVKVVGVDKRKEKAGIPLAADYRYKECRSSIVTEDKVFEIEEVIKHIRAIVEIEGISDDFIEIVEEEKNKDGELVSLTIGLRISKLNIEQRRRHLDKSVYYYMIRGMHNNEEVETTNITKGYLGADHVGTFEELEDDGKMVAEYIDGKWKYYINKDKK
ncbi:MAG: hypothetical protein HQ538_01045 [Parcubacteria group bacterium]|nr:hypothetical protein [Parcubacteria group bacterium]